MEEYVKMKNAKTSLAAVMISTTLLIFLAITFFTIDNEIKDITGEAVKDDLSYGYGLSDSPLEDDNVTVSEVGEDGA
jgi:hypothetical protein